MGKKNKRQNQEGHQHEQQSEGSNNQDNKIKGKVTIVLGVYIHCQGCADNVSKCLRGFEGVQEIEIDEKNHKVTVKAENADPVKVAERLRKKSGKHVDLISPKPSNNKKEEKKEEKKEPKVIEVVLKIYLHCEGCAKEVKYCIHKMPGVQTVEANMEKNIVIVKGNMEAEKLVEFISKRGGRHAEILKTEKKGQKNEKKENEGRQNNNNNNGGVYPKYPPELIYAPQLFSDENPNACSVM